MVTFDVAPPGVGVDFTAGRPARVLVDGAVVVTTTTDAAGRLNVPASIRSEDATIELDTTSGWNCGGSTTHRWPHVSLAGRPVSLTDQLTRFTCT